MSSRPGTRKFPRIPFDPARFPFFYGWVVLAAGTAGILMSVPGQTVGVSAFTDSLIGSLGLGRSQLSLGYLIGTLGSALMLSRAGRVYDRRGARIVAAVSAALLAATLLLLSFSVELSSGLAAALPFLPHSAVAFGVITMGFFLLRFSGQGMLTLASRNMVMEWFKARRGRANAIMGISISFGFSFAPRVFEALVRNHGWQGAWRWIAAGVTVFAAFIIVTFRDTPEAHGLTPDGSGTTGRIKLHPEAEAAAPFTLAEARRTYAFWVFALSLLLASLTVTAYTFHVVSIFADAGFSRSQAVAIFFPASIVAVSVQTIGSWLSDRIRLKYLCAAQLAGIAILSGGIVGLAPGWPVAVVIAGHGITQGIFGITSNVAWPRFFGRRHLGAISGLGTALSVSGSAVGPFIFSLGRDLSTNYTLPALFCGAAALVLFVASFRADRPEHPSHRDKLLDRTP